MPLHSRAYRSAPIVAALALFVAAGSCKSKKKADVPGDGTVAGGDALLLLQDAPDGLSMRLSEGTPAAPSRARARLAAAVTIPDARADRLLARMPSLVGETSDEVDFALRDRSRPPPRTGETISEPFPPRAGGAPAAAAEPKPLEILRTAPEGDVPIAPHLSVTFNQPMVAVTSHADSIADVPVSLEPQPKGQWRWIGTRTLVFDPEVRFPMATRYEVKVAAGTRSASGATLAKEARFRFTTPAPTIKASHPTHGPQPLEPLLFVQFDQRIDPAAVVATVSISADGRAYPARLAEPHEIARDKVVSGLVEAAKDADHSGRYLVFRAAGRLPPAATVRVDVGPGTPSREGPRKTSSAQSFHFQTYGPFTVEESRCSWGNQCPPQTPWHVRFSNAIDEESFDPDTIEIQPALPRRRITAHGDHLSIEGMSKSRTMYRVTLPASLADRFGQTLGTDTPLTFRVGDAHPSLIGPQGLVIADPADRTPSFDVYSVNVDSLDVQIFRVDPSRWKRFVTFMTANPREPQTPPGTRVVSDTIDIKGDRGSMAETRIDLAPALAKSGHGHAVVVVTPTTWPNPHKPVIRSWVQATDIGLDAFVDATELVAWATDLGDGRPMKDVALELLPSGADARTDGKGLATLPLSAPDDSGQTMLLARKGDDVAFLPENAHWWSNHGGWRKAEVGAGLSWFVFDDRQMYRPKEKVHVKGWLRVVDRGEGGDVGGLGGSVGTIDYKVIGPRGNELTKGSTKVNALGGFDTSFELPGTPNLGTARLELTARATRGGLGGSYAHSFQIQEFRRPEFEVTTSASEGPHLVGDGTDVTAHARYYAGGPLPGAEVAWSVTSSPTTFTPPNRSDFSFGTWIPWWTFRYDDHRASTRETLAGTTDGSGKHVLHIDFLSAKPPAPMSVVAEARVTDVNRQAWAAASTLLVHPSDLYIGLKRDRYFVEQGEPIEIESIVVDHDGAAAVGAEATIRAARLDWRYQNGAYEEIETDEQSCPVTAASTPSTCKFETPEGGTYRITATVTDDRGRPNQSQILVWVTGGKVPPKRNVEQEEVTLVPDREEYQPGDTAKILVQSPFFPAEGLMSVRRSGITRTERFEIRGPTTTLSVPIAETHIPNVHIQVDVVGSAVRLGDDGEPRKDLPRRPAYASGSINLQVPARTRTLNVALRLQESEIEPGGKTRLGIRVTDHRGQPTPGAEVAVIVVDESVLALSGYQTPDPIAAFYGQRPPGASDYHARQYLQLANPEQVGAQTSVSDRGAIGGDSDGDMVLMNGGEMEEAAAAPAAPAPAAPPGARQRKMAVAKDESAAAAAAQPIAVRKNFDALAVFRPEIETDARGRATIDIEVPDNLTRYRIMAIAVLGEKQFGTGESNITARMPLMVRPSAPRFLNFGDRFELPIVVQNQTDEDMEVDVALRTTNMALTAGRGRRVVVPANDRVEVRFPAAAEMPGTARFQVAAESGQWSDGAEQALPVWTPATTEAFATYGQLDEGAVRQPVAMPKGVIETFGGLEVTTSSTQLQALTDALLYLVDYPFECAEQTSSRILAVAALRDVLSAFAADGLPEPAAIEAAVARDIAALQSLQNPDGGFAFWVRGHESWPYVSIHGAHALSRAADKGFEVPKTMLDRSLEYLRHIENRIPSHYPPQVRRTLIAYALYVRKRMNDLDVARAVKLVDEAGLEGLSMEAIGWVLGTISGAPSATKHRAQIHRYLGNKVTETAATAHWSTSYSDGAHLILHSSRRADGVLLDALITDQPESDLIPKVVRGLLAHRVRGHWQNTQENSFVLLAMDSYFQRYEKATPRFVARMWLGDSLAAEQRFRGRSTDRHHLEVPMGYLAKTGGGDLTLAKQGRGRLYYRIGMTYAPSDLRLGPADHGFAIERRYEAIGDPGDVVRQQDGTWKIKAGAAVRVELTMVAESRRHHVALVDPLPAGLEPMNPSLAVTGEIPADPAAQEQDRFWWWLRPWYEHQNLRDERVEAFASLLPAGVHEYSYVARATTPGRFVVPPTKAEEMYFPETFGRTSSDVVIVD